MGVKLQLDRLLTFTDKRLDKQYARAIVFLEIQKRRATMLAKSPIPKAVKGFLIDPIAMQITSIELPGQSRDNLATMYKAIGCDLVECAYLNDSRDGVFVDEEGLLKSPTMFFYIEGLHQPLAGRGVVVGCDEEGETVSPKDVTLEWLRANTAFVKMLAPGVTAVAAPSKLQRKVAEFFA